MQRRWKCIPLAVFAALCLTAMACEPEVGSPCGPDAFVDARMQQQVGTNDLVQDIGFEACSQAFCASIDGSRPFCTRSCQTALECPDNFTCGQIVRFGRLACEDVDEFPNCIKPDGSPSDRPRLYCVAEREVIEKRDCDFGRGDADFCKSLVEQEASE